MNLRKIIHNQCNEDGEYIGLHHKYEIREDTSYSSIYKEVYSMTKKLKGFKDEFSRELEKDRTSHFFKEIRKK